MSFLTSVPTSPANRDFIVLPMSCCLFQLSYKFEINGFLSLKLAPKAKWKVLVESGITTPTVNGAGDDRSVLDVGRQSDLLGVRFPLFAVVSWVWGQITMGTTYLTSLFLLKGILNGKKSVNTTGDCLLKGPPSKSVAKHMQEILI